MIDSRLKKSTQLMATFHAGYLTADAPRRRVIARQEVHDVTGKAAQSSFVTVAKIPHEDKEFTHRMKEFQWQMAPFFAMMGSSPSTSKALF